MVTRGESVKRHDPNRAFSPSISLARVRQAPSTRPSRRWIHASSERGRARGIVPGNRSPFALRTHSRAASPPAAFDLHSQALRSTRWSRACVEFTDFSSTCGASADNVSADEVSECTFGSIASEYVTRAPSHVRTHVHSQECCVVNVECRCVGRRVVTCVESKAMSMRCFSSCV